MIIECIKVLEVNFCNDSFAVFLKWLNLTTNPFVLRLVFLTGPKLYGIPF